MNLRHQIIYRNGPVVCQFVQDLPQARTLDHVMKIVRTSARDLVGSHGASRQLVHAKLRRPWLGTVDRKKHLRATRRSHDGRQRGPGQRIDLRVGKIRLLGTEGLSTTDRHLGHQHAGRRRFYVHEKNQSSGFKTPCVALTAFDNKTSEHQAFECGFNSFLTKPVNSKSLIPTIEELLAA